MAAKKGGGAVNDGFNWMPAPEKVSQDLCPAGLEYLLQLDRFILSRYVETWSWSLTGRTYRVRNLDGQDVYIVKQDNTRWFSSTGVFQVLDCYQRQVAKFTTAKSTFLSSPWSDMNAEAPVGNNIGRVRHDFKFGSLEQTFSVFNNFGETVLQIKKSTKNIFASKVDYTILSVDGKQEVGVITKEYAGLMKTLFSVEAQHTFGISFPEDLDVKMKMVMVLAAIVIDILFFEPNND